MYINNRGKADNDECEQSVYDGNPVKIYGMMIKDEG